MTVCINFHLMSSSIFLCCSGIVMRDFYVDDDLNTNDNSAKKRNHGPNSTPIIETEFLRNPFLSLLMEAASLRHLVLLGIQCLHGCCFHFHKRLNQLGIETLDFIYHCSLTRLFLR